MVQLISTYGSKIRHLSILCLFVAFGLGTWIRVHGVFQYPYLADEPRITQSGTRDMLGIGPDRHLDTGLFTKMFGVPLRNGQFLALCGGSCKQVLWN